MSATACVRFGGNECYRGGIVESAQGVCTNGYGVKAGASIGRSARRAVLAEAARFCRCRARAAGGVAAVRSE